MVAPTEDTERSPATYVPPPFEGLPEVFQPGEHTTRSWRPLRPSKSPRRQRGAEPSTEAKSDAAKAKSDAAKAKSHPAKAKAHPAKVKSEPAAQAMPHREPVTAPTPVLRLAVPEEAEILRPRDAEHVVVPGPVVEEVAVRDPVIEELNLPELAVEEVAVPEPVVEQVVEQVGVPVVEELAVPEPVVEELAVPEPVVEELAIPEPVVEQVAVPEPAAEQVVVPEPAVAIEAPPPPPRPTLTPRAVVQLPPLVDLLPKPAPIPQLQPPAEVIVERPADLVVEPPADVVVKPPANMVVEPPADVVVKPPANMVVEPPADVVVEPPAVRAAAAPPIETVVPPPAPPIAQQPASGAAQPGRRLFARRLRPAPSMPTAAAKPAPLANRPAPLAPFVPPPPAGVITYVPADYEGGVDTEFQRVNLSAIAGHYGMVYPAKRTGRGVWVALVMVAVLAVGFIGWRVKFAGSDAGSAGVAYTSAAGHFSARFPAQPTETADHQRYGRIRVVYRFAGIPSDAFGVMEMDLSRRLPKPSKKLLNDVLTQLTGSGELTLLSRTDTTVVGHPAKQAEYYAQSGRLITVLDLAFSKRRFYVLVAQSGDAFDGLKESFVALP
jgi:hypothetical protein